MNGGHKSAKGGVGRDGSENTAFIQKTGDHDEITFFDLDWQPVQDVPHLSPIDNCDRLQPPWLSKWMDEWVEIGILIRQKNPKNVPSTKGFLAFF